MGAATPVHCVEGCGSDLLTVLLAVAGFVIAVIALLASVRATSYAGEQVRMMRREHNAFLDELNARALLDVEVHLHDQPDREVIETDASILNLRVAIGMKNTGQRRANYVLLNVRTRREIELKWAEPSANRLGPQTTPETIGGFAAHYISRTLSEPVGLSTGGTVVLFDLVIRVPRTEALSGAEVPAPEIAVPVEIEVSCDDLPEARRQINVPREWLVRGPVERV